MPFLLSNLIPFLHPKPSSVFLANLSCIAANSASFPTRPRIRGIVFDMDGTLTIPIIDFPSIYKAVLGEDDYRRIRAQNPFGIDILHLIADWSPEKQRKAYETIADFERQGLDGLQIMPGAAEFIPSLNLNGGLYTRAKST